jgi:hypothetical protein
MLDINTAIDAFELIYQKAHAAGMSAVEKLEVVPMIVGQETSFFSGKIDYAKPTYYVADGVCGFAWVDVYPANKGNTKAGKEERKLLERFGFRKNDYEKTHQLWVSAYNQSMQKKESYARAFAEVLRENGFKAYAGSRLD